MTNFKRYWLAFLLSLVGIWGCAQGPNGVLAERAKALESRCVALEDDLQSMTSARDALRKRYAEADEQRNRLEKELTLLQEVTKERDSLKQQLVVRTTERDQAQQHLEQLRTSLKSVLTQVESALAPQKPEVMSAKGVSSTSLTLQ